MKRKDCSLDALNGDRGLPRGIKKEKKKREKKRGINQRSKVVTQRQERRPELPTVTLIWHASKYKVHKLHQWHMLNCREEIKIRKLRLIVFVQRYSLHAGRLTAL